MSQAVYFELTPIDNDEAVGQPFESRAARLSSQKRGTGAAPKFFGVGRIASRNSTCRRVNARKAPSLNGLRLGNCRWDARN